MNTIEFETHLTAAGQIGVREELAATIPAGRPLRVVFLWDAGSDLLWRESGRARFEQSYSADDAVYEQLLHGPPGR